MRLVPGVGHCWMGVCRYSYHDLIRDNLTSHVVSEIFIEQFEEVSTAAALVSAAIIILIVIFIPKVRQFIQDLSSFNFVMFQDLHDQQVGFWE